MEDYVYILDYLPYGKYEEKHIGRNPLAYGLGDTEFKLLELFPKKDAEIWIDERVYIGKDKDKRKKIDRVKRRISFEDLTSTAQNEIPYVIAEIVKLHETRFINFFNKSMAISRKYHTLELLPGIGKKTMWAIINERKKSDFTSFEDFKERVSAISDPIKCITQRITLEIENPKSEKYHLFVMR